MLDTAYQEIIEQINADQALLFLGAGSTRNCRHPDGGRGFTGDELAQAILKDLNGGIDPGLKGISLMQASEFYTSSKGSARKGLDSLIEKLLGNLRPTAGHYLAAAFPWHTVVTTNYNRVAEDAWAAAHADGYAANELIPIRTDADIKLHEGNTTSTRLFKPHGCITIQKQQQNRMVLTSQDYFKSEKLRKDMYGAIRALANDCSTVFIGYSLTDYTFRNIFYTLYEELGQWTSRSYSVGPIDNPQYRKWLTRSMEDNFKTYVIDETFDTFMLRLTINRGYVHRKLKSRVLELWDQVEEDNKTHMRDLTKDDIASLPER